MLNQTEDHRQRVLQAASKTMRVWFIKVRKMKAIYHTLNLCNIDVTHKCLIAEVWCPVSDLDSIQFALRRGTVGRLLLFFTLPEPLNPETKTYNIGRVPGLTAPFFTHNHKLSVSRV